MAKKRKKRKPNKPGWIFYEFEVDDWEVHYSFRGKTKGDLTNPDKYDELTQLKLYGKPMHPVYKTVLINDKFIFHSGIITVADHRLKGTDIPVVKTRA